MTISPLWWQKGIIYQIYPRSFSDSNADGIGDLPGIIDRLDYVKSLEVQALWLSPIYPSPMADFGYDISNYLDINPIFGTLADFDRLVTEAHSRGLKVILDLVPNHTSNEHAWFLESRSSRDNPKRDWYIWRDPAPGGGPPNNWLSTFGGGAWEWDELTGQYYYHTFLKEQPDLNWRNPDVRKAILDTMRFWLDRGVDGFRVDVMWYFVKDDRFLDEPPNPKWKPGMEPYDSIQHIYTMDQPLVHDYVREMRAVLDAYDERMMVGEIYLPFDKLCTYYGQKMDEAHLPFNFSLILIPWDAKGIRENIEAYEAALPAEGWPNWVLGNHDQHRIASRVGVSQARVAQMLLLTLRGTPTSYYGDELGMTDVEIPPEKEQDPWGKNVPGLGLGRDPERTPMQWSDAPNAGFSPAEPWLPVSADYRTVNVEAEENDPSSMLSLYRALASLRNSTPALSGGSYASVDATADDVLAYLREKNGERILVVLNLGADTHRLDLSSLGASGEVLLNTTMARGGREGLAGLHIGPNEGMILRLAP